MAARGDAAADLQVQQAFTDPIAAHRLAQDDGQGRAAHRHGNAKFGKAALEPGEVPLGVGQLAVEQGPHLVDRVGQLVAAVLDVHHGLAVPHELPVHIGDTPHLTRPLLP